MNSTTCSPNFSRYALVFAGAAFFTSLAICATGQEAPPVAAPPPATAPSALPAPEAGQTPHTVPGPAPEQTMPQDYTIRSTMPLYLKYDLTSGLPMLGSPPQPSQRMAEETRRILALRRLLELGFNVEECKHALQLLERLRDIKTAPPADPERALQEEYRALLAARPTDPLPPSSAIKIMDAASFYRQEQAKVWADMAREIGSQRAKGLRVLVGQEANWIVDPTRPLYEWKLMPDRTHLLMPDRIVPDSSYSSKKSTHPAPQVPPATPGTNSASPNRDLPMNYPPVPPGAKSKAASTEQNLQAYNNATDKFVSNMRSLVLNSNLSAAYSPGTVRLSLDEMIDLLRSKIAVMTGK